MSAVSASPGDEAPGRRQWRPGGRLLPRIRTFLAWWGTSLAAWLPRRVRELFGLAGRRLLLEVRGDELALTLHDSESSQLLAAVPLAPLRETDGDALAPLLQRRLAETPRWLLLPARMGLRRTLTLPEAAGERLQDILRFEIDRQTPFAADDVRYGHRVLGRRGDGSLDVELVVVPRVAIDAAVAALGPLGGTLAGIDLAVEGEDGNRTPLGVNLIDDAGRQRRGDPQRRYQWLLAAVAVVFVALALWQIRANHAAAAADFEAEVAAEATRARGASQQRQQLADLAEGMRFLDRQRASRPMTVAVLDELSRRLPDTTYLEKVAIEGDRILLIGLSTEASALVGYLEGSPLWQAPALAGALQNDPRTRADRFTLTARLADAAPATTQSQEPERAASAR
ncbi:PilN domain-containing protein [Luteimonas sp. BDR2-5]|uniref:PilN domain-containing protein n=1 Tax=Proluteimonas luteida TaxID=2878685 RepID=UPI001E3B234B|nr:PilN domain-containing protein [Luteimonas sp. BDR2-5]MCD9027403.1 PilN domain-containing protein [Luteimonas sp. BDR2-5]